MSLVCATVQILTFLFFIWKFRLNLNIFLAHWTSYCLQNNFTFWWSWWRTLTNFIMQVIVLATQGNWYGRKGEEDTSGTDLASSVRRDAVPTILSSVQRYSPNITIIWDGWICKFAVWLRFTFFVYKVYIDFSSGMRNRTVAVVTVQ